MSDKREVQRTDTEEIAEREPDDAREDRGEGGESLGRRMDRDTELAENLADEAESESEAERRFEQEKEGHRPESLPTEERP